MVSGGSGALPLWLFVSYGGGHVKALLPVAQRVRELGIAEPVYLALTTAAPIVRAAGLRTLGFRDLVDPGDRRALAKGAELVDQLAVQAADRDESVAYLGLSYVEMEERLGVDAAARAYAQYDRQAFMPLGVLQRAIRFLRPALVVATNSPRAEQAAIEAAGSLGVPSVCLVDLLGIWERERLARRDYATALCVLNAGVRDSIVAAGRPAADVHVTGNPAFDSLHDPAVRAEGARYRSELGWNGLHVCMYASSPEPQGVAGVAGTGDPAFPRRIERALIDAVLANPALALWIRRHPSEARAGDALPALHPRIRESLPEMRVQACIHASDEVIVTVSTVGVEASIAGKMVTQVRGSILDHLSPYLAMGVADRELTLGELAQAYVQQASVRPMKKTAAASDFATQGATQRVVQVLQSIDGRGRAR
jgi:hypothetical protein